MNLLRIKILSVIIIFAAIVLLALPEFSVKINNSTYTFPSVGFSRIGYPVDFPSLRKSVGFGDITEYKGELVIDSSLDDKTKEEQAKNTLNQIQKRIDNAELSDIFVYLTEEYVDDEIKYNINLKIPEYYNSKNTYAQMLMAKANITFDIVNPLSDVTISLSDKDINSTFRSNSIEVAVSETQSTRINLPNLVLTFNESLLTELSKINLVNVSAQNQEQANNPEQSYVAMNIDLLPVYQLANHEGNTNWVRAVLLNTDQNIGDSKVATDVIKITSTYFRDDPLTNSIEVNYTPKTINSGVNISNNFTILLLGGIVLNLVLFLTLVLLNKKSLVKTIFFIFSLNFSLLLTLVMFKFLSGNLSYGSAIGFLFITVFNIGVLNRIFSKDYNKSLLLNLLLVLVFTLLGLYKLPINYRLAIDSMALTVVFLMVQILCVLTVYELGRNLYSKEKSYLKKLFLNR